MGAERDLGEDFGAFYRSELDVVLAFCFRRTHTRELAADLTAEVFAAALAGRAKYRPSRGTPRQWLLGIAANKVADAQRRGHVERRAQKRLGIDQITWTDGDLGRVPSSANTEPLGEALDGLPA
jgi:RNA polymerase sigma-70 factor, ECF subfamily